MATYNPSTDAPDPATVNLSASPYAGTLETIAPGINNLVANTQAVGSSWVDTLTSLIPILQSTDEQKQLLAMQADRARQGLPPLQSGASNSIPTWVLLGGAALVAYLLLRRA